MLISRKSRAARTKITETEEHRTIAAYFKKVGLGPGAKAIHIRNERGSASERITASQMGVLAGVPDWLIIYDGKAGFIELKPRGFKEKMERGVGITTHVLRQLSVHADIRNCNCWVSICESLDEVLDELYKHDVPLRSESVTDERIRRGMITGLRT